MFLTLLRIRLQTGKALIDITDKLQLRLKEIAFPILTLHGGKDGTIPVAASEALINLTVTPTENKKMVLYELANHDLLHDAVTDKVVKEMCDWASARILKK
jgi:esterase/lipase